MKLFIALILLPFAALAQLRELECTLMDNPGTQVVQASASHPDNAILIVYSSFDNLLFRSSMSAINKTNYNSTAGRYELLIEPVKQIIFVGAPGFIERSVATVSPKPKEALYFKVDEKLADVLATKGNVTIESEPSDAAILINDIETVHRTPVSNDLPAGVVKISIRKQYYLDFDTTMRVRANEIIRLKRNLTPSWAELKVTTEHQEARIFINGQERARGQLEITGMQSGLKPGVYELSVLLDNYRNYHLTLQLKPGQKQNITAKLEPIMCKISARTEPSGATLRIDGMVAGITPVETTYIAGVHVISLEKQGYGTITRTVTLNEQSPTNFSETLQTGKSMTIASNPAGAKLFLDGKALGSTPWMGAITFGDHRLRIVNGSRSVDSNLRVQPETEASLDFDVREQAVITIKSKPSGSGVFLNGQPIGVTPVSINTTVGPNTVRITRTNYLDYTTTLDVEEPGSYSADLQPTDEYKKALEEKRKKVRQSIWAVIVIGGLIALDGSK